MNLVTRSPSRTIALASLVHDKAESVFKNLAFLTATSDGLVPCGAICQDQDGVISAGVSVDCDAIEGMLESALECSLKAGFGDAGIGSDVAEHCRHVGVDHPGSFSAAADADPVFADLE